jgi:L-malate glycosyltransferase
MTKKIAIVCNYVLKADRIGGMDRFYVAYDAKLKALGYEVHWYFSYYKGLDFFSGLTIFSSEKTEVSGHFLNEAAMYNRHYQVMVTHFLALCTSFFKKAKPYADYTIAVDHNPRPLEGFPLSKKIKNRIKGILYSGYIDKFIGVSEYTKTNILKDYGQFLKSKTQVVYNGIETSVFKKRVDENKNKFIVCSHLRYSKGIQDLLAALDMMDEGTKNKIGIDVYGEGPYEQELLQMTRDFGLDGIVQYKGSSSELHLLLANYSYLLQPTHMECFSLSILESLAANVPVITTTVGGNQEIIKDNINGFIFFPKDQKALADILEKVISGKKKITSQVDLQIENEFSLEKMVEGHMLLLP